VRESSDIESPCPSCGQLVLDIDVRCKFCGASLGSTGSQRLLGQVVLGQYELVDVLGQGGMSVVYKGRHQLTDQPVALKILPPELAAHSQVKSRFLEEAKALAQLDHPNIVHLYNFGQENGSFVLAMQFVGGKTWERLILENQRLDWPTSARIAVDVLRALEYAHGRGIVHRDMKPSNVLVRQSDGAATVMDFGIAKMTTSSRLTATGQTMGTVRYMSPEQVRGQEVDPSTDLYSLGATLYESVTGDTPFGGSTHFEIMSKHLTDLPVPPTQRGAKMPAVLEQAILRCLAKRPSDRFGSARELRKLVESVLREQDAGLVETQKVGRELLAESLAQKISPPLGIQAGAPIRVATSVPAEPGSRRRWIAWVAGLVVLAAGAAAFTLTQRNGETTDDTWDRQLATLPQNVAFPELGIEAVRAPAGIAPAQVAEEYKTALTAFSEYLLANGAQRPPTSPVHTIVVVPRATLCLPSTYPGRTVPPTCASAIHAFRVGDSTLVVVDDAKEWTKAMRLGIPEAVCVASGAESPACRLAPEFGLKD
jgi:serine/threonine protein kinase